LAPAVAPLCAIGVAIAIALDQWWKIIWVRLDDGSKVIDQRTSRAVVTR
jgi:hypothetical protein